MGHSHIQPKNDGTFTIEIVILNLERMAHWNYNFIGKNTTLLVKMENGPYHGLPISITSIANITRWSYLFVTFYTFICYYLLYAYDNVCCNGSPCYTSSLILQLQICMILVMLFTRQMILYSVREKLTSWGPLDGCGRSVNTQDHKGWLPLPTLLNPHVSITILKSNTLYGLNQTHFSLTSNWWFHGSRSSILTQIYNHFASISYKPKLQVFSAKHFQQS